MRRAVRGVLDAGGFVRLRKPQNHAFSYQHEKVILYDQAYVTAGSHNFTSNSVERCEEDIVCTSSADVVRSVHAHFLEVWRAGQEMTTETVPSIEEFDIGRERRRMEASRSRSERREREAGTREASGTADPGPGAAEATRAGSGVPPRNLGRRARAPGTAAGSGPGAAQATRAGNSAPSTG